MPQHGSNYFAVVGQKDQKVKFNLFTTLSSCIGITNAATRQQIFCPQTPRPWQSKGQISTFSEHGHVAYQIKGNRKYSKMVANIM